MVKIHDEQWLSKLDATLAPPVTPVAVVVPVPSAPSTEPVPIAAVAEVELPPTSPPELVAVVQTPPRPPRNHPPAPAITHLPKVISGEMPALGLLDPLLRDERIGDILVNGTQSIYVDRDGKLVNSGLRFTSNEDVWEIAQRIVKSVDQTLSPSRPMVDTRLPDGSRVNIVAPPMALDGVSISIRKFPSRQITLESMVKAGQLTPELGKFLSECCRDRLNMIVCGGSGAGKTTMLNALSAAISPDERIVTIEDSAELKLQQPHVVRLESKNVLAIDKAHQAVSIRDLVRNALRMRPDRIIVGESRGAEALDVLQAMNTGHDGSMTTLHANSPRDALSRLETMVALAMPQMAVRLVRQQIASTVHLIIHMARCKDGVRRLTNISEVAGMEGEVIIMQDLVVYTEATNDRQGHFRWANGSPRHPLIVDAARNSGLLRSKG